MDSAAEKPNILEGFQFVNIFRTFRMSIHFSKLFIAFCAVLTLAIAGALMDLSKSVVATDALGAHPNELDAYIANPAQFSRYVETYKDSSIRMGVYETLWEFGKQQFHAAIENLFAFNLTGVANNVRLYMNAVEWAAKRHWIYLSIFAVIKLAVIAFAGGAICRIAALEFSRDEKPGMMEALRFSCKRFATFFLTPLGLLLFVAVPVLIVMLLALVVNVPWGIGDVWLLIFMPCMLVISFAVGLLLIGIVGGYIMIYPAIAYDGADAFDAGGRAINYVRSKPWHLGFYYAVTVIYGAICYLFVRLVAFLLLWLTYVALRFSVGANSVGGASDKIMALWSEPSYTQLFSISSLTSGKWEPFVAYVIYLYVLVVIGLLIAFITSFYFSAGTVIYAMMRKQVDNTPFDDVYIYHEEPKFESPAEQEQTTEAPEKPAEPEPEHKTPEQPVAEQEEEKEEPPDEEPAQEQQEDETPEQPKKTDAKKTKKGKKKDT